MAYSADADCRTVVFALDGQLWVLRVGEDPREPGGVPEPMPAAGAVTDPRIDPTGQNPEGYARSSTITEAASLARPLLLMHGMADDNVVVAHTLRMSAALLTADRPHQVLPLPGIHMPIDVIGQLRRYELAFLTEALGAGRPEAD